MNFHGLVEQDGDNLVVRIPDAVLRAQGIQQGDVVEITVRRSTTSRVEALSNLQALGRLLQLPLGCQV